MATKNIKKEEILGVDDKSIKEYADLFSEHGLKSLDIKHGDIEISLKKDIQKQSVNMPVKEVYMEPAVYQTSTSANTAIESVNTPIKEKKSEKEYKKITSPIVGTFYTSPSPDSPPFIKEGDTVSSSTVIGIVEAMKMMNEIKAGINGKIVKRVVDNNSAIEVGAVLFLVEP